jgi:hypothetical protein
MIWFCRKLKRYLVLALAGFVLILLSAVPSSARNDLVSSFSDRPSSLLEAPDFLDSAAPINSSPVDPNLYAGYPIQTSGSTGLRLQFSRSQGITNLSYGGAALLDAQRDRNSGFRVNGYTLKRANGITQNFAGNQNVSIVTGPTTVSWGYAWGQVTAQFSQSVNRLDISIDVINTSPVDTIERIELSPLTLRFPRRLAFNSQELVWGIEGPPVISANFGSGALAIANNDSSQILTVGLISSVNRQDTAYPLFVSTGLPWYAGDYLWPRFKRPIAPGASDHFNISLRFGASGSSGFDLAPDVYGDYAATFPFQLKWDDRRPIGRLVPASHTEELDFSTNPRGWLNDPTINIFSQGGRRLFHDRMMAYADQSIGNLKAINAQGVIFWDVEGEQYQDISYVADPRLVRQFAPEMHQIADEFFGKFRDAGLRVGVTLRPQQVRSRINNTGQRSFYQEENVDVFKVLSDKIAYARNRWGATLFYIDSNVGRSEYTLSSPSYDASVFKRLGEIYPDVLLIPEWQDAHYFAYTAPYDEINPANPPLNHIGSPEVRRELYPEAFQVVTVRDDTLSAAKYREVVDRVRAGDILLTDAWYWNRALDKIRLAYQEANF